MIFRFEDNEYELNKDPTVRAVEQVLKFDQMMTLSYLDTANLSEEDKKKEIGKMLQEKILGDRILMAKYLAEQQIAEPVRTIMLCTGEEYEAVQEMPLRPLFDKCIEVMGGTASDFFSEFLKSSQSRKTPTTTASQGSGT